MTPTNRDRKTCSPVTATDKVNGMATGLGYRFAGAEAHRPATALVPGATPSRGPAGIDRSDDRPERDCQSRGSDRTRLVQVATWRPRPAAKPANPN